MSDEVEQAGTRLKELTREISKLEAQQVVCCSRQLSPGPAHTVAPLLERGTAVNWMFATCAWGRPDCFMAQAGGMHNAAHSCQAGGHPS